MMNDFIYKSSEVYNNIQNSVEDFCEEAKVIEYAKCILINNKTLEDFVIDGIYVSVFQSGDDYFLNYSDIELKLEVKDNLIYDYNRE